MTTNRLKGFTIIEVVLVLAIASLIFLMVFLALPALQSGQRDAARKNDMAAVAQALTSYSSNNNGKLPTNATYTNTGSGYGTTGLGTYLSSVGSNTEKVIIQVKPATFPATSTPNDGEILVYPGSSCDAAGTTVGTYTIKAGTTRSYAIVTKLEGGGGVAYCQ